MSLMTLLATVMFEAAGEVLGFTMMPRAPAPDARVLEIPWIRLPETVTSLTFVLSRMPQIALGPFPATEDVMPVIVLPVIEPPTTELFRMMPPADAAVAERLRTVLPEIVGAVANWTKIPTRPIPSAPGAAGPIVLFEIVRPSIMAVAGFEGPYTWTP